MNTLSAGAVAFAERLRAHATQMALQPKEAGAELLVYATDRHARYAPDFLQVGGFADRIKGIVMAYLISVYAGRGFAIDWTKPAPLAPTLEHAAYDWRPSTWRNAILGARTARHVDLIDGIALLEGLSPTEIGPLVLSDAALAYLNINVFSHTLVSKMFPEVDPNAAFQAAFQSLFRFTVPSAFSPLWAQIEAARAAHGAVVGVHLRTGEGNGWNDPAMGSWEQAPDALAQAALLAAERGMTSPAFYFATDSTKAKAAVRAMASPPGPVLIADHDVQHIDRSDVQGRASFDFAIVEFMALAHADLVVGGAGQYWFTAAMAGGKPNRRLA